MTISTGEKSDERRAPLTIRGLGSDSWRALVEVAPALARASALPVGCGILLLLFSDKPAAYLAFIPFGLVGISVHRAIMFGPSGLKHPWGVWLNVRAMQYALWLWLLMGLTVFIVVMPWVMASSMLSFSEPVRHGLFAALAFILLPAAGAAALTYEGNLLAALALGHRDMKGYERRMFRDWKRFPKHSFRTIAVLVFGILAAGVGAFMVLARILPEGLGARGFGAVIYVLAVAVLSAVCAVQAVAFMRLDFPGVPRFPKGVKWARPRVLLPCGGPKLTGQQRLLERGGIR